MKCRWHLSVMAKGHLTERKRSQQRSSLALLATHGAHHVSQESTKEVLNTIAIHSAQITWGGTLSGSVTTFISVCQPLLCAFVVKCFFFPACVCIFIYAVDENNLLENVYFMMRNVNLLDIIRELKINLSVIFKSSCL